MEAVTLDNCCNLLIAVIGLLVVYITASLTGISSGYILLTVVAFGGILGLATSTGASGGAVLAALVVAAIVLGVSSSTGVSGLYLFVGVIILALFMGLTSMVGLSGVYMGIGLVAITVLLGVGWYLLYGRAGTMPTVSPFADMTKEEEELEKQAAELAKEGFYGGVAVGAGVPDCLRVSSEGAQLHALFASKASAVEEGPGDFKELTLLLSQLSCFKKDLMGVAKQVEATRYQPFATQLDLEPIAETTARCFAKTIPSRDLDLSFEKWSKRGTFLITRLCTATNLTEAEVRKAETLFQKFLADVKDVAKDACLTGTPTILAEPQASPRDAKAYDPGSSGREYFGYY